jgi:hypothetical protein
LCEWRFSIESAAFFGYTTFVDFDWQRIADSVAFDAAPGCLMKRIGLLIALFAGLILVLPPITAQDGKKDADKAQKKDDEKSNKKDDEKKDPEKKDDEKKEEKKKEKKPIEKMPAYGQVIRTKILSVNGASNRDFTIELQEVDQKKVYDYNNWKAQRATQLAQQQFNASTQKDVNQRFQQLANYQRDLANFQIESAKRSTQIYSTKPLEVRGHEDAKVRTLFLPVQFDDQGFPKKWTEKEKREFRGETQIPGYPSDFDQIKSGQVIDLYLFKKPAPAKGEKKKKGPDDDPVPMAAAPEFILLVILTEGKN